MKPELCYLRCLLINQSGTSAPQTPSTHRSEARGGCIDFADLTTSRTRFVNKLMLIDPLTDDPIVVAGSANFSDASTRRNDENMVVTRGNTRVADIYLGEFMRLYRHHAFRESLEWRRLDDPPKPLRTDDWWTDYFGSTPRSSRRQYFARS